MYNLTVNIYKEDVKIGIIKSLNYEMYKGGKIYGNASNILIDKEYHKICDYNIYHKICDYNIDDIKQSLFEIVIYKNDIILNKLIDLYFYPISYITITDKSIIIDYASFQTFGFIKDGLRFLNATVKT